MKNYFLLLFLALTGMRVAATTSVSRAEFSRAIVDANGFITAAGSATCNGTTNFLLARFTAFGAKDLAYGNYGFITNAIGQTSGAQALALASNQLIVVGGTQINSLQESAFACYNRDGTLYTGFNGTGVLTRSIGTGAVLNSVVVDAQGQYVAAGIAVVDGAPLTIVARYNPDGTPDSSFGLTGIAMKRIFGNAGSYDLALQSTNKIVTAGFTINPAGQRSFALIRFNIDGSVDSTLGTVGTIVTSIGTDSCAYAIVSLPNNYIVCAGVSDHQSAMVRYTSTGAIDTSFGHNGIVTTAVGNNSQINDIALQPDGYLVTAGSSDTHCALMRYTHQGELDTTFGNGGIVTTRIGLSCTANAVAIQTDGKIVVCGSCDQGAVVMRYTATGQLDPLFGTNGAVIFPVADDAPDITGITDINIAPDAAIAYDKLNVAGSITDSDISTQAAIADSKLQTIITPGKIDNRATSATPFSVPNGIVSRDTLGNFSANSITATLVGNVQGAASQNVLKNGDAMLGTLILQAGSAQSPSLQFADNDQTGFSAQENSISVTTNGAQRLLIDQNGMLTINAPLAGAALTIGDGGAVIGGDITNSGNLLFNTQSTPLNAVGTTLAAGLKIFTGTANTGLSGSVVINYSAAGFMYPPIICANALNGINASITINNVTTNAALIASAANLNVPFNYIAVGI